MSPISRGPVPRLASSRHVNKLSIYLSIGAEEGGGGGGAKGSSNICREGEEEEDPLEEKVTAESSLYPNSLQ